MEVVGALARWRLLRRSRLGSWESFEMSMYMHKCLVNELVGASKVVEVLVHWRSLGPLRVGSSVQFIDFYKVREVERIVLSVVHNS